MELDAPGGLPDPSALPQLAQQLGPGMVALYARAVPPLGGSIITGTATLAQPAQASQDASGAVTLANGLVRVTLDPAQGGTFKDLGLSEGPGLLKGPGDDVVYWDDTGDIYGAHFGAERARESRVPARVAILAQGPLIARAQATFTLGSQPITKTVTLRAASPLVEVALQIRALPESSAVLQIPTALAPQARTDDLGFTSFTHVLDDHPIVPGDVTYHREIFYPIMSWSDVSAGGQGLTLITHGLQGLGGMSTLNLLLVRQVTDPDGESLTDPGYHTLRYAYMPHAGSAADARPWLAAYAFNQPLIPAWRMGGEFVVGVPFTGPRRLLAGPAAHPWSGSFSLLSAQGGILADLFRDGDSLKALVLSADPTDPVSLSAGGRSVTLPPAALSIVPAPVQVPTSP